MIDLQANWQPIAAAILGLIVVGRQAWPTVRRRGQKLFERFGMESETPQGSDEAPPDGFKAHVERVLAACPKAPEATQLEYLKSGLTVAETLRGEVARYAEGEQ